MAESGPNSGGLSNFFLKMKARYARLTLLLRKQGNEQLTFFPKKTNILTIFPKKTNISEDVFRILKMM